VVCSRSAGPALTRPPKTPYADLGDVSGGKPDKSQAHKRSGLRGILGNKASNTRIRLRGSGTKLCRRSTGELVICESRLWQRGPLEAISAGDWRRPGMM